MKINNVEKKMSGGGPETRKLDMSEFIRLADADKIKADVENEIIQLLNESLENKESLEKVLVIGLTEHQEKNCSN